MTTTDRNQREDADRTRGNVACTRQSMARCQPVSTDGPWPCTTANPSALHSP